MNKTVGIIKPDAVKAGNMANIISDISNNSLLKPILLKTHTLTDAQAREFYAVHSNQPWFNDLIKFMTSGQVLFMVLEADNAVEVWRNLMTELREKYGTTIQCNAVHGSDSNESAQIEEKFIETL